MLNYFSKFKGEGVALPPKAKIQAIIFAWIGSFIAISTVAILTNITNNPLVLGSFGASCVLLFGFPKSPFSQPRNVILGHTLSTLIGLLFYHLVSQEWWGLGLALATAVAIMIATRTVHPPAGSNPVIVYLTGAKWNFLLTPTLIGAIILVIVALLYINLDKKQHYPSYWF
ncbi:MAG: HPP family protein [Sulfurovum sp.]|nr:HPP family protein [Sulfurovum sp.]